EWLNGLICRFGYRTVYENGFVHPIVHNLVERYHPDACGKNIMTVNQEAYDWAFRFILRHSTVTAITLSRSCRISLRTAYVALGIRHASDEGRLSDQFLITINRMRDTFSAC
ncbi:MAG: hypothetical protein ACRCUT_05940, partial [Spirochaetota bacterium]